MTEDGLMLPVTAEVYRTKNKTVSEKFLHCSCHSLCMGIIVCFIKLPPIRERNTNIRQI